MDTKLHHVYLVWNKNKVEKKRLEDVLGQFNENVI